ncbi:hypothetical protein [Clostridium felsineum]|uniref:Uncharacterized protein n=1 Tax=Clostridium felsineum TaxID=36839 RepID=A0A1S8L4L3_9CLOT|nr:hypothetical protein [Clostridium felsineum]URZ06723.1 hypothetical protein CLROS_020560 [Clostridium felsineum]URZ11756.1 hypothetical protein CROST_024730 [Clostridium felsineum]
MKKLKGDASMVVLSLFTLILIGLLVEFVFFHMLIVKAAEGVQDDVVFSNLAIYKNVDQNSLSLDDKNLKIEDCNSALNTFKEYLQKNMKLNSNLDSLDDSFKGTITINEFTIYNVKGNYVEILTYKPQDNVFIKSEVKNKNENIVKTSDNVVVKNTSIHTSISYNVKLLFGQVNTVTTSVDTDIVK